MLQNKHENKFDRLCSGLRIFVNRYLIILKSLLFPGQQTSFIINLPTLVCHPEILWRITPLTQLHRFKKYGSENTYLIFSRFEDVKLASLILPKWPVYKYWCRRVIIVVDTGSCNKMKMFLLYMHNTCSPQVLRGEHSDNLRLAPIIVSTLRKSD